MMFNKKFLTKDYYIRKLFPEYYYWSNAKRYYRSITGKRMNYLHPKNINEKLMWLTRYWRDPIKTKCADKFLVREYIKENGLSHILIPLIGVWNRANDINFDLLPQQFVLKCNHGSGYNIICLDKEKLDVESTINRLNEWMNEDYARFTFEIHYRAIPHRIVCEKLISQAAPVEYQFWCINGKAESMLVCRKNHDGTYDAASYSLNWERLFDRKYEDSNLLFDKPKCLNELIAIAEKLASPFPFVRADFYVVGDKIYFAELTFSPAANILSAYKEDFLHRLGGGLRLPKKFIPYKIR